MYVLTMVTANTNLVRPRTVMTDSAQPANNHQNKKRHQRSVILLSLLGTCMFLLILCGCLITALVLVGRSLSNGILSSTVRANQAKNSSDSYLYAVKDTSTTKLINNNRGLVIKSIGDELKEVSDNRTIGLKYNKLVNMTALKMSKIIEQLTWRLPSEIKPTLYKLILHPDLTTKTFSGNVSIYLDISKPISFIAVHSKKLTVSHSKLVRSSATGDNEITVPNVNSFEHPDYEYWVTEVEKPLDIGEYILDLTFNGSLTNRIVGLYQSSYKDINNQTRYIATSKFEPTYARQAFPCFDEPAMKAKFKISLVRPSTENYHALSNMNEESTEPTPDRQNTVVHFKTSVPMSTYLACFIVSDFKEKHQTINTSNIGTPFDIRVYATPAQLDKVDFALKAGVKVTEHFIKYFEIAYPLPKLDMVAIPDFVSGAMEHWGLVTFRETSLLYNESISSTANKQNVASVVAHELAHMWFGNLVTMAWWNELWLNEGFATYLQYKGMHAAFPDWGVLDHFLVNTLHSVMSLDSTFAAHPIVQTANNPDQITELFDAITYSKGASVIRMLADFVGEEKFRKSVTKYLNQHQYGNAVTDDLLTQIENIDDANKEVKYIMSTWTKQSGLPVVKVERKSANQYRLTQKRFLSNPANENIQPDDSEFKYRWAIPITFTTDVDTEKVHHAWFQHTDSEAIIKVPAEHKWVKLNKNQVGYYRVNYPVELWKNFGETLVKEPNVFSVSDRAHLLNDAFSLAEATQLGYDVALELTRFLENEMEYVPWTVATSKLTVMRKLLYYTVDYPKFLKYARKVVESAYKKVGWTVESDHNKNLLRVKILTFACAVGNSDCLTNASKQFNVWLNNPKVRPAPDLRSIIYIYGMQVNGNENNWNKIWDLYLAEGDAQEKTKLLNSLASPTNPWILKRFIDLAWDEKNVRSQDYFTCLALIADNPIGEPIVWEYVRENWETLVNRFGLNERYLGRMIPAILRNFSTTTKLNEVQAFSAKYPEAGAGATARKEALQTIENNIQWLKNNGKKVSEWLQIATKDLE